MPNDTALTRRHFLGNAAALGAAGLAVTGAAEGQLQPEEVPEQFSGLAPLWPAPEAQQSVTSTPPLAALVLNKAAFGPRPGDVDAFNALGIDDASRLSAWVDIQVNPGVSDPDVDERLDALAASLEPLDQTAYDTIGKTAVQLWTEHARNGDYQQRNRPVWQMERLTLLRGAYSQWQLREVLFDFWFNHLNIYGREFPSEGMMPHYDRTLREHMFGNFRDILKTNARTASMLYYLDNYANTWPYPNENYAREVLELHTLGAIENYYGAVDPTSLPDNIKNQRTGYTEIDVFEFAKALTGWGVSDTSDSSPDTGEFLFRPLRHYKDWAKAPIRVLDVELTATAGEADVTTILDYLASHFGTARFIAWKLCTRLIGDDPPASIVDSTAEEFYQRRDDPDQLKEVYRHILLSSEFQTTWGTKIKRPIETLLRAMRGADVDFTIRVDHSVSNSVFGRLDDTGQYPFGYGAPTGFPDEREMWQGSGPLIMSWRTVTYMLRQSTLVNLAQQTNTGIPLSNERTPVNIVDFWINRALGYPLDAAVAERMVQFITGILPGLSTDPINTNSADTGANSTYQRIIRAVVGLILMSPDAMRR